MTDEADLGTKPSSNYGLHSHSGDLIEEDIYVSDGSLSSDDDESEDNEEEEDGGDEKMEDNDEDEGGENKEKTTKGTASKKDPSSNNSNNGPELVLTTSKMGLMRRGGISSLLNTQVNRTWVRGGAGENGTNKDDATNNNNNNNNAENDSTGNKDKEEKEEEEEITDPAQLLLIQQQKLEAAKQSARILESSENAGRDPCLFSKRTAFDIRMDQIEDKPWTTGGDPVDYFNYSLTEEDWLEYAERQLNIRQELTDASKQKRLPDPVLVQVVPRAPKVQGDRVAVRVKKKLDDDDDDNEEKDKVDDDDDSDGEGGGVDMAVELGPLATKKEKEQDGSAGGVANKTGDAKDVKDEKKDESNDENKKEMKQEKIVGGAWGAGASKDSVLLVIG
jgi:hypothetical protein